MSLTFDRGEIRRRVQHAIRSTSSSPLSSADVNRAMDMVVREFVSQTECNKNIAIFSVPDTTDPAPDGSLEYDENGFNPSLIYVDMEGWPHYRLDYCESMETMERWLIADDGCDIDIPFLRSDAISSLSLLSATSKYPYAAEMRRPDLFRFLPGLLASAYPFKVRFEYLEAVRSLITNDLYPAGDSPYIVQTTGTGLNDLTANVEGSTDGPVLSFKVTVGGATSPNKVDISLNGTVISAAVSMTGEAQTILGTSFTFAAIIGHTLNDVFTVYIDDYLTPSVPARFRFMMVDGTIARCMPELRDAQGELYAAKFERYKSQAYQKKDSYHAGTERRVRNTYRGAGG